MANEYSRSDFLDTEKRNVDTRIASAVTFFNAYPERKRGRFLDTYEELCRRSDFLEAAVWCLETVTNNATNMDKVLDTYVPDLYHKALDESIYNTKDAKKIYITKVQQLREMYPKQEDPILWAMSDIKKAIRYRNSDWYWRSLRKYVENVTKYYIWLRQKIFPVGPPPTAKS